MGNFVNNDDKKESRLNSQSSVKLSVYEESVKKTNEFRTVFCFLLKNVKMAQNHILLLIVTNRMEKQF